MPNVISFYRIANWLYKNKIPLIPELLQGIVFIIYNCHISYMSEIGKGTTFLHKGMATLILKNVRIGNNCKIGMNVMITGKSPYKSVANIGDKVWIGPGVIISGPVIIGNNVVIAPNSMVIKSIPDGSIVAGNPAKIIGWVDDLDYDIMKNESWKEGYMPFLTFNKK